MRAVRALVGCPVTVGVIEAADPVSVPRDDLRTNVERSCADDQRAASTADTKARG